MTKTDFKQRACNANETFYSPFPARSTQHEEVRSPPRPDLAACLSARGTYVKPPFHHQIVSKQLLPKRDARAAPDR